MSVEGYTILSELSHGGAHINYLARQAGTGRTVVLQLMPGGWYGEPLPGLLAKFEVLSLLDHPNILPVLGVGPCENGGYLVRTHVEGQTLAEQLREGPIEPRQAASWACRLAQAMVHAHEHGVIGCTLSAHDILIDRRGEVFLSTLDCAHVRFLHPPVPSDPSTAALFGILPCLPPEQIRGERRVGDPRRDVWALGTLLYQMLTGQLPFPRSSPLQMLHAVLEEEIPRPRSLRSEIPADLERITLGCLRKNPEQRYPSMETVATLLRGYLDGKSIAGDVPETLVGRMGRWVRGWLVGEVIPPK